MGMSVVGLGVTGLGGLFVAYGMMPGLKGDSQINDVLTICPFSLGASSIALFARVGGGIYTKAADVGADLVGKVEAGIPEDDPRNPAVIADNVGDNVGDVAGMGADLFESYVGAIISTMVIGAGVTLSSGEGTMQFVYLPLILAAVGIVSSIVGTFFVKVEEGGNAQHALDMGTWIAGALMALASAGVIHQLLPEYFRLPGNNMEYHKMGLFAAMVGSLVAGIAIGFVTEHYCAKNKAVMKSLRHPTRVPYNIIPGITVGMRSTLTHHSDLYRHHGGLPLLRFVRHRRGFGMLATWCSVGCGCFWPHR